MKLADKFNTVDEAKDISIPANAFKDMIAAMSNSAMAMKKLKDKSLSSQIQELELEIFGAKKRLK